MLDFFGEIDDNMSMKAPIFKIYRCRITGLYIVSDGVSYSNFMPVRKDARLEQVRRIKSARRAAEIQTLTAKIKRTKNTCHKALLIERRAELVAKTNDEKRQAAILRAPAIA